MRALALTSILSLALAAPAEAQSDACKSVQTQINDLCGGGPDCKVESKEQAQKALAFLKSAPAATEENDKKVKELLTKEPTKESIDKIVMAMGSTCVYGGHIKVWKGLAGLAKKDKSALDAKDLVAAFKDWGLKDSTLNPTLISLSIRTATASHFIETGLLKVDKKGLKQLETLRSAVKEDTRKISASIDEAGKSAKKTDPAPGEGDPKLWLEALRREHGIALQHGQAWTEWLKTNVK